MSLKFEHDSLICFVRNVNSRTEKHGEEEKLAVDVSLRLMEPEHWSKVARSLMGIGDDDTKDVTDFLHAQGVLFTKVNWAEEFVFHRINFRMGRTKIATLEDAKVNRFVMEWGKNLGMIFRVQALASSETIGALTGLKTEKRCRVESVYTATEEQLASLEDKEEQTEMKLPAATDDQAQDEHEHETA